MTTTYSHPGPTLVDQDLKIKVYDTTLRTNMVLVDLVEEVNRTTASFIYDAGPATDPVRVTARSVYNPAKDLTTNTMSYDSLVRSTVTESGVIIDKKQGASISTYHEGRIPLSTQYLLDDVCAVFGFYTKTLTGVNGYATPALLDSFARGVLITAAK